MSDTAVLPPPKIFLADDSNRLLVARKPLSQGAEVVADFNDPNKFTVTIPSAERCYAYQDSDTLCWAACTQTLLAQMNIHLNQERLAAEFVPPDADDQTAGVGVVIRALNPDLEDQVDQRDVVPIDLQPITSDQLITELLAGRLCIVGLVEDREANMGHACVICGATFAKLKAGAPVNIAKSSNTSALDAAAEQSEFSPQYGLYSIQIFDPFKDKLGGVRPMNAQLFSQQAEFITSHVLARDVLLAALNAPPGVVQRGRLAVKSKREVAKERAGARGVANNSGGSSAKVNGVNSSKSQKDDSKKKPAG